MKEKIEKILNQNNLSPNEQELLWEAIRYNLKILPTDELKNNLLTQLENSKITFESNSFERNDGNIYDGRIQSQFVNKKLTHEVTLRKGSNKLHTNVHEIGHLTERHSPTLVNGKINIGGVNVMVNSTKKQYGQFFTECLREIITIATLSNETPKNVDLAHLSIPEEKISGVYSKFIDYTQLFLYAMNDEHNKPSSTENYKNNYMLKATYEHPTILEDQFNKFCEGYTYQDIASIMDKYCSSENSIPNRKEMEALGSAITSYYVNYLNNLKIDYSKKDERMATFLKLRKNVVNSYNKALAFQRGEE